MCELKKKIIRDKSSLNKENNEERDGGGNLEDYFLLSSLIRAALPARSRR